MFVCFSKQTRKIEPKKKVREAAPRNPQAIDGGRGILGDTRERGGRKAEGKSKPCLIDGYLKTTKDFRAWGGQQEIDERSRGWGYKGMCIHDREWKRVKVMNERDKCVGPTYPKSDGRRE